MTNQNGKTPAPEANAAKAASNGGTGIDRELQVKYQKTVRAIFGTDGKPGYFVSPTGEFVTDIGTAFLLKDSAIVLTGSPGTGKTTLLRIIAYMLTGATGTLAVVNCTQDTRPEDFIYEVEIRTREKTDTATTPYGQVTTYEFDPAPRPMLTSPFALINEVNRLRPTSVNALLSVLAERSIIVRGKLLKRATGIVMMDYNPHVAAPLEWAFVDRIRSNIHVPALLDLGDQFRLLRTKYGAGKHVEDLVEYASKALAQMTMKEVERVWEDVDRVAIDDSALASLVLYTNVFSSCKFDLSTKWTSFELPCQQCDFRETCITTQLEHPVFTRSLDHLVKMLKAEAYFAGRDKVVLSEDIFPALRRVMLHRLAVKPEFAARYVDAQAWYETEVEQRLLELQEKWQQAKAVFDDINRKLGAKQDAEAAKAFNEFRKQARDIVSLRVVEMIEPKLETVTESRFQSLYAKYLAYGKAGFTRDDLDAPENRAGDELPPKFAQKISDLRDKLLARLQVLVEVQAGRYGEFVAALAAVEPSAADIAEPPRYGGDKRRLADGSEFDIRSEREKYIIDCTAASSAVAEAVRKFALRRP